MKTYFIDVILPLAVPRAFTYRVPRNMEGYAAKGMRVIVPFGKSKLYTGVVVGVHENPPEGYSAKYMDSFLDSEPVVTEIQIDLWNWISDYYMCFPGEVMLAAVPAALRLSSETKYILNPAFDGDLSDFSEKEVLLLEALSKAEIMGSDEISEILQVKNIQHSLKNLLERAAVMIVENVKEKFKPRTETYISLRPAVADEEGLEAAFKNLERAPKQLEALMMFVQLSGRYSGSEVEVKRTKLQKAADISSSIITELIKKGIFQAEDREVGRLPVYQKSEKPGFDLSDLQTEALARIESEFESKKVTLLHGVTSSGKTEIYIKLIEKELKAGKQVLYMLPEIALTTQMIMRLQNYFGANVVVYHSRFNQNERVEVWNKVLQNTSGDGRLILGARSSLLLPFSNLGLIIVDEEHENSFKQFDPAPRYHARDAAIVLANRHGARTLLGSATPAMESLENARGGKYGYVELTKRFGGIAPPVIELASLKTKDKGIGYFTSELLEETKAALEKGEQVILFQNRRGYAPVLICEVCGWAPECVRCDVTLTYHKIRERLVCHYCGNKYTAPPTCPACGSHKVKLAGFGTERIEEEIQIQFPEAKVARMDLDTTRAKNAYHQILSDFSDGLVDILIGTQMVTKGLDFGNVSLVGILNADLLLKFPDFRATEKAFQLMTQVAGRAGRRETRGKVIIQSYDTSQWVLQQVITGNLNEVYKHEADERRKFLYPPYSRLIKLTFRHRELELVDYCAAKYAEALGKFIPEKQILGPEYPMVARVKNRYNKNILIKIIPFDGLAEIKNKLMELNGVFFKDKQFRSVRLIINVDPQ